MGLEFDKIYLGDSFVLDKEIPDKSVDMILEDMPYGITACKWDVKIDLEKYWESRKRIIKDNGAIVLTASQPFTSMLVMSNLKMFKYEWIVNKSRPSGFTHAKNKPLSSHEVVLIFSNGFTTHRNQTTKRMIYNPQGIIFCKRILSNTKIRKNGHDVSFSKRPSHKEEYIQINTNYPKTSLYFKGECKLIHPTQKPVALFEYLIKTYTNEGDLVFDGFAGSGTTGAACIHTNRKFICIEKDEGYFNLAKERIENERKQGSLKL